MTTALSTEIDPAIRAYVDEQLAPIRERLPDDRVTLVVFSGELDRQLASLVIATGAAAMGLEVSIFYTFWGLSALKKATHLDGKTLKEKLFALMILGDDRCVAATYVMGTVAHRRESG